MTIQGLLKKNLYPFILNIASHYFKFQAGSKGKARARNTVLLLINITHNVLVDFSI